jgi:hypothetical protein
MAQKPVRTLLNPVGSAGESAASALGGGASHGISRAGGALQAATAAGTAAVDTPAQMAAANTMKGRMLNAANQMGGAVQKSFAPGGQGHTGLTKVLPRAAELGSAVGAGMALHAPLSGAALLGKGVGSAAGAGAGMLAAAAPDIAEAASHGIGHAAEGVHHALGGVADVAHHAATDIVGEQAHHVGAAGLQGATQGQGLMGRMRNAAQSAIGAAPTSVRHLLAGGAPVGHGPAMAHG